MKALHVVCTYQPPQLLGQPYYMQSRQATLWNLRQQRRRRRVSSMKVDKDEYLIKLSDHLPCKCQFPSLVCAVICMIPASHTSGGIGYMQFSRVLG